MPSAVSLMARSPSRIAAAAESRGSVAGRYVSWTLADIDTCRAESVRALGDDRVRRVWSEGAALPLADAAVQRLPCARFTRLPMPAPVSAGGRRGATGGAGDEQCGYRPSAVSLGADRGIARSQRACEDGMPKPHRSCLLGHSTPHLSAGSALARRPPR